MAHGAFVLQVMTVQALQRILSALSQRLVVTDSKEEVSDSLVALLHLLQSEEVRDTVLSHSQDASLVELCRDLVSGLSKSVRLASTSIGLTAVAVFDAVCQNVKARQLLLQHSDTEPIFERIPQLLADMPEHSSIPLSVAHLTRYPSAQRRVLASGRCAKLLAGLNQLMLCSDARIASDAACAVGNIAFNDEGRYQVLAYQHLDDVIAGLLHILKAPEELAGNAAWAIGNLCRDTKWCGKMLEKADFVEEVIKGIRNICETEDVQTACDWACAISMMTATERGQKLVLAHSDIETLRTRLIHNIWLNKELKPNDDRLLHAACLALRNLLETKEGKDQYDGTMRQIMSADNSDQVMHSNNIDDLIRELDFEVGANAAITMRGLPSTTIAPVGAGSSGRRSGDNQGSWEAVAPVEQDSVCIKSLDGAILRSLPINLFTTEAVIQDSKPLIEDGAEGEAGDYMIRWSLSRDGTVPVPPHMAKSQRKSTGNGGEKGPDIPKNDANSEMRRVPVLVVDLTGTCGVDDTRTNSPKSAKKKRDSSHLENGADEGDASRMSGSRAASDGEREKADADGGEMGPAPTGHTVKSVVCETCTETMLAVAWEPVFPESTDGCRFVCDGGNGGSYRNVASLTRAEMSFDGKYRCSITKLLPGREYRVLAIARTRFKPCHGAQTMFETKAVLRTKAAVPTAPEKCVLSSRTRTSLKIRWVAPDGCGLGIDGYEVAWCRAKLEESVEEGGESNDATGADGGYKVDGEWEEVKEKLSAKETSWQMKKLGPGQHFGFRVRAMNNEGNGPWSEDAFYCTAASVPSAPENLTNMNDDDCTSAGAGKLALSWDKPNCNGSPILAYVLEQQDTVRGGAFEVVYNGPETHFVVGGLMAGNSYKFRVKASNNIGAGEYSPLLEAAGMAAVPAACDAPTLVRAKVNALTIKWGEPDCRGAEIRAYKVMLAEAGQETVPSKKTKFGKAWQGTERTCELSTGLSAGKRYFLRVIAINALGEGEGGTVATVETEPDVPAAPHGLALVSKGHWTAKIKWKSPQVLNGAAITGYRIEVEQAGDGTTRTINVSGPCCEHEVGELQPERAYTIRVRATNKVGCSPYSDPLRITPALPPPPPPGAPRLIAAKPHGMSVRWDPPAGGIPVEGYRIEVLPEGAEQNGKFSNHDVHTYKADECRADLVGLRAGLSYKVRVVARNKSGFGEKGPVAVLRTEAVTPAPTNLQTQIAECDSSLVALCSWDRVEAVGAAAGGPITYHAEVDDGGEGSADFKQVYVGAKTQFSHHLQSGKSYKFRVRAVSAIGSSAWSVIKGFSRALPIQGVPDGVAVRLLDDARTVSLVWNAPISPNVGAYQVRVDLQEGKKRRLDEGFDYRRDDLTEGLHRFQVRAMVNGKWSEWSKEVALTIPPNLASHPPKRPVMTGGSKGPGSEQASGLGMGVAGADESKQKEWPGQDFSLLGNAVGGAVNSVPVSVPMPGGFDSSSLGAGPDAFPIGASPPSGVEHDLYKGAGDQDVVDKMFGIGGGTMQASQVRSAQSLFGSDLSAAADQMGALRLTQDAYATATEPDSRVLGEARGALGALGRAAGVPEMGAIGGGVGSVGVGFGVTAAHPQLPQHQTQQFSGGATEGGHNFSAGGRGGGMPKLLGGGGLGGLMGEEEDVLMSLRSIPTGLLDEVRQIQKNWHGCNMSSACMLSHEIVRECLPG